MNKKQPAPHVRALRHPRTRILPGEVYPAHLIAMYNFMEEYVKKNQYPPSNREMVDNEFATSTSVIRHYYDWMQRFGMIEVVPGISRGIRLHPRTDWQKHETKQPVKVNMETQHANAQ